MTHKSKNVQVILKDLCIKCGEFLEKRNNSETCLNISTNLRKVLVTIKIFQHDFLLLNKCSHDIFYVKLNVTLEIYGFEIKENSEKCDFERFQPLY